MQKTAFELRISDLSSDCALPIYWTRLRPSSASPANRFEVLECRAALEAVKAKSLDGDPPRPGGLDVLSQHILGTACAGPFKADELYREITSAFPYKHLIRKDFDRTLGFVATGGYALKSYERYRRLVLDKEGFYRVAHLQHVKRYRLNVGTIVEAPVLKVRLRNGRLLGEVEQYFVIVLLPGDSFIFACQLLAFEVLREKDVVEIGRAKV